MSICIIMWCYVFQRFKSPLMHKFSCKFPNLHAPWREVQVRFFKPHYCEFVIYNVDRVSCNGGIFWSLDATRLVTLTQSAQVLFSLKAFLDSEKPFS